MIMNANDINDIQERVSASFDKQSIMTTLGASLLSVEPGEVVIKLPFTSGICQQDGFVHAGVITTVVDSACGYAAMTVMPAEARVLTIEFKSNFTAPAVGDVFFAKGQVKKAGKTVVVTTGEVYARHVDVDDDASASFFTSNIQSTSWQNNDKDKLVALMQASMMTLYPQ